MEYKLTEAKLLEEVDAECRRTGSNGFLSDIVPNVLHKHIEAADSSSGPAR